MKTWQKWLIVTGVAILVAILATSYLWHRNTVKRYEVLIHDSAAFYKTELTRINDSIVSKNQLILDLNTAVQLGLIESGKLKAEKWKLLSNNIKLKEEVRLLADSITFKSPPDTIVKLVDNIPSIYIKTPALFGEDNMFYSINGKVTYEGVVMDSLKFYSYPEINVGWRRTGFLKKPEPAVTYYNRNPYYVLKDIEAIQIDNKTKWYDRKIFWAILGAGSALVINSAIK